MGKAERRRRSVRVRIIQLAILSCNCEATQRRCLPGYFPPPPSHSACGRPVLSSLSPRLSSRPYQQITCASSPAITVLSLQQEPLNGDFQHAGAVSAFPCTSRPGRIVCPCIEMAKGMTNVRPVSTSLH